MVSIREVKTRTLETPEAISDHLAGVWRKSSGAAFKRGQRVTIANRDTLPGNLGVGDTAVVVLHAAGSEAAWVLLLTDGGAELVVSLPVAILAPRG